MAQLYFYYAAMNAGKSTLLLQASYNYRERGMETLIFVPAVDERFGGGKAASRIGLEAPAITFQREDDLLERVKKETVNRTISCVLVDEAQFLAREQVLQLTEICDRLGIPVLAYGLRTDFQGNLFEGSGHLLAWADNMIEIKAICHCGRKATMVLRMGPDGVAVKDGEQIEIGGNERYISVCRRHYKDGQAFAEKLD